MKLNLGCGDKKVAGYVNVDKYGNPDLRIDLNIFPWPWKDNSIDEIYSYGYFEHAIQFMRTWRESHRVLIPNGILHLVVPHARSAQTPWPEQHLHQFSIYTFKHHLMYDFDYAGGKHLFDTISLRHLYGPKLRFLSPFANLHPLAWDWIGLPVSDIEWRGVKLQPL